jgi:hypothetical protein
MADQPVNLAVFEAFQHKLFSHLDGIDRRFEAFEQAMNARFDELVAAEPRYALRADVQDLRARVEGFEGQVEPLRKRVGRD